MAEPRLAPGGVEIVILNWNTWPLLGRVLDGLRDLRDRRDVLVTVLDNASRDCGDDVLAGFPWVRVSRMERNLGYAGAYNHELARTTAEFVLLLNSDAFATPAAVDGLVECLRRHPHAAGVAPALEDDSGRPQTGAYGYQPTFLRWAMELSGLSVLPGLKPLGIWGRQQHRGGEVPVGWISGACLLLRTEAVREVGYLDERFFMYMEDMEWCVRARRLGWEIYYQPGVSVTHLFGSSQSGHSTRWIRAWRDFLRAENPSWQVRLLAAMGALGFGWRAAVSATGSWWGHAHARVRKGRMWAYAKGFAEIAFGRNGTV